MHYDRFMEICVLIIEPNDAVRKLLEKNFLDQFAAQVLTAKSLSEGKELFEKNYCQLVITRNFSEVEQIAQDFLSYLYDKNLKTPVIILGDIESSTQFHVSVLNKFRIEEINRLVLKSLGLKKEDFEHVKLPSYIPYPVSFFHLLRYFPVDIYILINKKSGDEYIKRFQEGENFTSEDLVKYESMGLVNFYINKDDNHLFMNVFAIQTISELKKSKDISGAINNLANTFTISTNLLSQLGISEDVVYLTDESIKYMQSLLSKNDKISLMLKELLSNTLSFSYKRSYLISLFGTILLPKLEFGSIEQKELYTSKFVMVSFFHDLFLEDEKLLKINSYEDLQKLKKDLTKFEIELVETHANKISNLLLQYPKLPSGIDVLVKQHHGSSNGIGFPENFSNNISPMAISFIVIEDFVTQLILSNDLTSIPRILYVLKDRYTLPSYKKTVHELFQLFKNPGRPEDK